jgi:hypothetical protein
MIGLLLSLLLALQSPVALFFMFVFGIFHIWDFWNIIICRIRWSGAPQTHMPCWLLASSEKPNQAMLQDPRQETPFVYGAICYRHQSD